MTGISPIGNMSKLRISSSCEGSAYGPVLILQNRRVWAKRSSSKPFPLSQTLSEYSYLFQSSLATFRTTTIRKRLLPQFENSIQLFLH